MTRKKAIVIEDSSDEEDRERRLQALRKALNEVHWEHGRIMFLQSELEQHVLAAQRAASRAEEALEDIQESLGDWSVSGKLSSPVSTRYLTALSRQASDDSLQYEDPETEELMRTVQLSPGGSSVKVEDDTVSSQPNNVLVNARPSTPPRTPSKPANAIAPSSSIKRSVPRREEASLVSPTPTKRARKGPKGGFLVLNGKDGVNGVFGSWAVAASVEQNVSGAIIQGFNSFEEAQNAYDLCSSSGLLAYLTLPDHEKKWFVVLRGS
ncbi:hypothetical protein VNI00_018882 [Paramarasmius palmivorus]|uniref:Uncharacterized protein n=1 Tax=Paramarasmius palmivorus TaxID=297713 RepID=A0AAW0ASH5_9AGAR